MNWFRKISRPSIALPALSERRPHTRIRAWSEMIARVRRASLDSDERELVDILQTNLPYRPHAHFFDWLYRRNPEGEALAWVAADAHTNRIIGAAAAFPRSI